MLSRATQVNEYFVKPAAQTVDRPPPPKVKSPSPVPTEEEEEEDEDDYYREDRSETPEPVVDDEDEESEPDIWEDVMVPVVDFFNSKTAGEETVSAVWESQGCRLTLNLFLSQTFV